LAISPPELTLAVLDQRRPLPETSRTTVARVRKAIIEVLGSRGVKTLAEAPHALKLTLSYEENPPPQFSPEDCIRIEARVELQGGTWASAGGFSCYGNQNAYGFMVSGDATTAFQMALDMTLRELERQLMRASAGMQAVTARTLRSR
jgi:hypothetical protein